MFVYKNTEWRIKTHEINIYTVRYQMANGLPVKSTFISYLKTTNDEAGFYLLTEIFNKWGLQSLKMSPISIPSDKTKALSKGLL